jgi:hypothetical protein
MFAGVATGIFCVPEVQNKRNMISNKNENKSTEKRRNK